MKLDAGEIKVKTFFHHPLPLAIGVFKRIIVSLPFFFVATFFSGLLSPVEMFWLYIAIGFVFIVIILYEVLIYCLDRLIITNKRVIHSNWKNLFDVDESGAEFSEIQDIETTEHGILSVIPLLNYGVFHLETAATGVSIHFDRAIDPEGIKRFVYHVQQKPSKIEQEPIPEIHIYDRAPEKVEESRVVGSDK